MFVPASGWLVLVWLEQDSLSGHSGQLHAMSADVFLV